MADKSSQLILDALSRAATEPGGLPLFGSKSASGLFPASEPARVAAQRSKSENLIHVVRTEKRGKNDVEFCAVTEKGLSYLLREVSPRPVLEDLVRAVEARRQQVASLVIAAEQTQADLERLRTVTEKVLHTLGSAPPAVSVNGTSRNGHHQPGDLPGTMPGLLTQWQLAHPTEDCALPELYRQLNPQPTIGIFHDALRQLHGESRIYLHPWTGPLYAMPEPSFALLIGHEVAYYASTRK